MTIQPLSFFTLPRELRDEIYGHLLPISQPAPSFQTLVRQSFQVDSTHYSYRMHANDIMSLALSNSHIYSEVQDVTQRIATSKATNKAHMDVAMFGHKIYMTFTSLPFTPCFLPRTSGASKINMDLDVSLRVGDTSLFYPEDTSRHQQLWMRLGELFLEGPNFKPYGPSVRQPVRLDNLDLKMVFMDSYTPATHMQCAMKILIDLRMTAAYGLWDGYVKNISFKALRQSEEESGQFLIHPTKIQMSRAPELDGTFPVVV